MNSYTIDIQKQMNRLANISNCIFLGQQVGVTDFYGMLKDISMKKRLELPVAEELQMGMSIGLAIEGYLPISVYQRMDFLWRASDQIINHLDKMSQLSVYDTKVIIFTTIGATRPLHPGVQHCNDYVKAFKNIVKFPVFKITNKRETSLAFNYAINEKSSCMIVTLAEMF